MSDGAHPPDAATEYLQMLKRGGATLALIGGLLYAGGLLIWSIYLGSIGVFDLTLTRPHYLLTGTSALLFLIPPFVVLQLHHMLTTRKEEWRFIPFSTKFILILCIAGLMTFLLEVLHGSSGSLGLDWRALRHWGIYLKNLEVITYGIMVIVVSVMFFDRLHFFNRKGAWPRKPVPNSILLCTGLVAQLLFIRSYALGVHPQIVQSFGGAKPQEATVSLSQAGVDYCSNLEIPGEVWTQEGKVRLVYETGALIYFQVYMNSKYTLVAIPKSLLGAISFGTGVLEGQAGAKTPVEFRHRGTEEGTDQPRVDREDQEPANEDGLETR